MKVVGDAIAASSAFGGSMVPSGGRGDVTLLREDIRFLKPAPSRLGAIGDRSTKARGSSARWPFPSSGTLRSLLYLKKQEKEKTHSHLFRSRRAHRMARARLKKAAKLASEGSKDFYDEIAAALYRYAADKSAASPSGLTSSSIAVLLGEHSVPDVLRREFQDVLDACEEARFTPGARSREEMDSLRRRTEELIVEVERHWSK